MNEYMQLITNFPPRPITSEKQFWATQGQINVLLDKGDLTLDEQDYLTLLGMTIERYEDEHEPEIELRGIRLIRGLTKDFYERIKERMIK